MYSQFPFGQTKLKSYSLQNFNLVCLEINFWINFCARPRSLPPLPKYKSVVEGFLLQCNDQEALVQQKGNYLKKKLLFKRSPIVNWCIYSLRGSLYENARKATIIFVTLSPLFNFFNNSFRDIQEKHNFNSRQIFQILPEVNFKKFNQQYLLKKNLLQIPLKIFLGNF